MTRQAIQAPIKTYLAIAALLVVSTALVGSPPGSSPEAKKDKPDRGAETDANKEIRREAERVVRQIDLEILSDDKWTKVPRIEEPLLYYSDPTRTNDRGSVWGWGQKGRPVALLELYRGEDFRTKWVFAICNTSGGKLRARRSGAPWWNENDSGAELKEVPGASAPSAEASVRQRQVKLLAQKFTAHEFWDPNNSRYELRLLKRPLCTYRDEANGVLEGGLFTLANGTNPEIMLFVEARVDPKNNSKRVWQYTVGRLAHAELHLEYDGKEVFDAPRGNRVSASDKPYWLDFLNAAVDADPEKP
ncbi:MAG TPA: hypothetical protein VMF69_23030 [Gemmataceae bacterium]|nr:hypothetical protein [Gemmataceae bacterium]